MKCPLLFRSLVSVKTVPYVAVQLFDPGVISPEAPWPAELLRHLVAYVFVDKPGADERLVGAAYHINHPVISDARMTDFPALWF